MQVAVPAVTVWVPQPVTGAPSMSNAAVPSEGAPPPGETPPTVAVNVIAWSVTAPAAEVDTDVVVDAAVTTWLNAEDPDASKLASPLYSAWIWYGVCPAVRTSVQAAEADPVSTTLLPPEHCGAAPDSGVIVKVTLPVGVPEPLFDTFAVIVTVCPVTEGLLDDVSLVVVASWPTVWVSEPDDDR